MGAGPAPSRVTGCGRQVPSDWLRIFFEPNLFPYKYPNIPNPSNTSYLLAYEDGTECSKMLAFKLKTPGNHPEESIQHSEHRES
jgi:hypothetical protein